jgi:small-conductance mechanosensitive channel
MIAQSTEPGSEGQSGEPGSDGGLISDIGSEIRVAVDRWSAGQIGLTDVLVALGLLAAAALGAWVVRRVTARLTEGLEGPASTASVVVGQLISVAIYLFAMALVLEVLGFSLGPVVIIVLIVTLVVMFLRPLIQNLSSGLLLQMRGPFSPGDVVETNGITGIVEEVKTRTVIVVTNDGKTVHIPSKEVLGSVLVNYSSIGRRRSEMTLLLDEGARVSEMADRLRRAVEGVSTVFDEPPPAVVVAGFEGTRPRLRVLFWHRPELWAERAACDRVGRVLVDLFNSSDMTLADPAVVVRTIGPARSGDVEERSD